MTRRMTRSTRPRKAATVAIVAEDRPADAPAAAAGGTRRTPPGSSGARRTSRRAPACATAARAASTLPGPQRAERARIRHGSKSRRGHVVSRYEILGSDGFLHARRGRAGPRVSPAALPRCSPQISRCRRLVTALLAFAWLGDRLVRRDGGPWWARALVFTALVLGVLDGRPAAALVLAGLRARAPLGVLDADRRAAGRSTVLKGFAVGARARRPWRWSRSSGSIHALPVVVAAGRRAAARRSSRCCSSFVAPRRARADLQQVRAARATARSPPSCARSPSAPACRCATCSSPTRAGARRRQNAYVSGLGATRRVVVYDTLLGDGGAAASSRSSSRTSSGTGGTATSRRGRCSSWRASRVGVLLCGRSTRRRGGFRRAPLRRWGVLELVDAAAHAPRSPAARAPRRPVRARRSPATRLRSRRRSAGSRRPTSRDLDPPRVVVRACSSPIRRRRSGCACAATIR